MTIINGYLSLGVYKLYTVQLLMLTKILNYKIVLGLNKNYNIIHYFLPSILIAWVH